ncbi:MAG TPA: hypothetical protein VJ692_14980 [Nitrospiraceae bacterium]|nr:hypothetical protein [Nitrospiraceae bacterium]
MINKRHIQASWNAESLQPSAEEHAEISALPKGNRRFIAPASLMPGWDY